jgi:hypothetical protein
MPYTSSVSRYLKFARLTATWMWPSAVCVKMSVKGGTRGAVSARLILKANANGIRKKTVRNSSGGRMMSQRPGRSSNLMDSA